MKLILRNKVTSAVLILIGGAIYGGYSFFEFVNGPVQEMAREIASINQETSSLKAEVTKVKKFADNIPAIQQSFREQSLQLESVLDSIPRSFEFNALLKKFNLLAQSAGIEIISFKPQPGEKEVGYFKVSNIDLNLRGGFVATLVFLDQISKLKRVVAFDDIRMVPIKGADSAAGRGVQSSETSIKLRAYRLSDS